MEFFTYTPISWGHCIGVDPYYLTHKALEVGHHPEIILAGRRINDNMGNFTAEKTISELAKHGTSPLGANITILGLSFKEDCPDLRNTKVVSIIERLKHYNCNVKISDPCVIPKDAETQYNIKLQNIDDIKHQDAVIIAVAHKQYFKLPLEFWERILNQEGIIIDIKSVFKKDFFSKMNVRHWTL